MTDAVCLVCLQIKHYKFDESQLSVSNSSDAERTASDVGKNNMRCESFLDSDRWMESAVGGLH